MLMGKNFYPDVHMEEGLTEIVKTHEDQGGWSTDSPVKELGLHNRAFDQPLVCI